MRDEIADQILQMCRVPDEPSVYVLGTLARTVNFRAQQIRAHNLACALNSVESGEVAVVGGGVAGVTFAMAAERLGFKVTLFERHEKVLSIQAQNHTRYIHPTIALWPFERLVSESAGIPLLNWSEDLVKSVIAKMRTAWEKHNSANEIEVIPNCTCRGWNRDTAGRYYLQNQIGKGNKQCGPYRVIVLATGFGLDGEVGRGGWCYWNNDYLDDTGISKRETSWLVSGCGDGGLIDTLRLKLREFGNGKFMYPLLQNKENDSEIEDFRLKLIEVETQGVGAYDSESDARAHDISIQLQQRYQNLKIPAKILETLEGKLRDDTRVYLNGRGPSFHNPNASVLNRVLLHILESKGYVTYVQGSLIDVKADGPFRDGKLPRPDGWIVTTRNGALPKELRIDALILRHGPRHELDSLLGSSQLSVLRSKFAINPDPTTVKAWKGNTFTRKLQPEKDAGSAIGYVYREIAPVESSPKLPTEGWRVSSDPSLESYCSIGFGVKMGNGRRGFLSVMFGKSSPSESRQVFFGPSPEHSVSGIVIAETAWEQPIGFQVIEPTSPDDFPDSAFLPAGMGNLELNCKVHKLGATSGLTTGTLTSKHANMRLETGDGQVELEDQCIVMGDSYFTRPGDAGAGVIRTDDFAAVGIVVGGGGDGKMAVVFPIGRILAELKCTLLND